MPSSTFHLCPSSLYCLMSIFYLFFWSALGFLRIKELYSVPSIPVYCICYYSQSYGFSSSHVQLWELDHKEGWEPKNWCFQTMVLEKTLESPLNARRSNQSILREISPEYSLEGLMLKLKLQYFDAKNWLIGKDPDAGKDWRQEEKGMTEYEMFGCHHRLDVHKFKHTLGDKDKKDWCAAVRGVSKSGTWLRDWTKLNWLATI